MKLTACSLIQTDFERLWQLTQFPEQHARWDLRFSEISYLPKGEDEKIQRFRYLTRLGFGLKIEGWGETFGKVGPNGAISALRFGSADPKSLICQGAGSWVYKPKQHQLEFSTSYDYQVRYGRMGRMVDQLVFRPLMLWATRWSFDRLRLWLERGLAPERAFLFWLVKILLRLGLSLFWLVTGLVNPAFPPVIGLITLGCSLWLLSGQKEEWLNRFAPIFLLLLLLLLLISPTVLTSRSVPVSVGAEGLLLPLLFGLAGHLLLLRLVPLVPKACRARANYSRSKKS